MSYWQNFYKKYSVTDAPTDFAKFTLDLIPQYIKKPFSQISLVDIACGNARDTIFFRNAGIEALGIDLFSNSTDLPYVSKKNAMDLKVKNDVYYLRFFLHAIKEEEADRVLMNLSKIMGENSLIFIETRSSKGFSEDEKIETHFASPIGEKHYRMLYSSEYLKRKFGKNFNILLLEERQGLAVFENEDPFVIRLIMKKKFE